MTDEHVFFMSNDEGKLVDWRVSHTANFSHITSQTNVYCNSLTCTDAASFAVVQLP